MANLVEDHVRISVTLRRLPDGTDHVQIVAESFTADETRVRQFMVPDLWPDLSAARKAQVTGILDDAVTYVKNQLAMP